jgi:hypothetical protein
VSKAVVRELEEKLLLAVKEKENLEDQLQEKQTEVRGQPFLNFSPVSKDR